MLILLYRLPPSDHATKQARTVHALWGVNLLNSLLSVANIGGIHKGERQEQKAHISNKVRTGARRTFLTLMLVIKMYLSLSLLGGRLLCRVSTPRCSVYCLVLFCPCFMLNLILIINGAKVRTNSESCKFFWKFLSESRDLYGFAMSP